MNSALQALLSERSVDPRSVGPRGGNVHAPELNSSARRASLNTERTDDGVHTLHRKDGWHDTATVGLINEQPWHRMAAYMLLQKRTNSEIAMAANQ